MRAARPNRGFTLIEVVTVIVIAGVLAAMVGPLVAGSLKGYVMLQQRAELTDAAESAVRLLVQEIRNALPNSIRAGGTALEMINVIDVARFRHDPPGGDLARLDFTNTEFDLVAPFFHTAPGTLPRNFRLAILGADGDPYATAGNHSAITPPDTTVTLSAVDANGAQHVRLSDGQKFPLDSPHRQVFLVSGPVTYWCNNGSLWRYSGYPVSPLQVVPPAAPPEMVAGHIVACKFEYDATAAPGLGVVEMTLAFSDQGESVTLFHRAHVDNTP